MAEIPYVGIVESLLYNNVYEARLLIGGEHGKQTHARS